MSEYKKRIAMFAVIAVLAAAGLAAAISAISPQGGITSTQITSPRGTTTSTQLTSVELPPQQNDFSLKGPVPLVTVSPRNNTFTLTYSATTLGFPVTDISFNLSESYVAIYTNETEWARYSQVCSSSSSSEESTLSSEGSMGQASVTSVSVVTETGEPCDSSPAPGWVPVNGSAVQQYAKLNPNEVEMSVQPTTIAANETVSLQFRITLNLKPGVYAIGLALGVQTTSLFEFSRLNPFPVIVKS
jgi:hypothetical protein